jgi:hypothetical protein
LVLVHVLGYYDSELEGVIVIGPISPDHTNPFKALLFVVVQGAQDTEYSDSKSV